MAAVEHDSEHLREYGEPTEAVPEPVIVGSQGILIPEMAVTAPSRLQEYPDRLLRFGKDTLIAGTEAWEFVRNPDLQKRYREKVSAERAVMLREGEESVEFYARSRSGRPLSTSYILREGTDATRPTIITEHGLGGTASNFDLLKDAMPDETFISRNRYPRAGEAHRMPRDLKKRFYVEVCRLAGIIKKNQQERGNGVILVGHSMGTMYMRALNELAHDCPSLIGARDAEEVQEVILGQVLINPPKLGNALSGNSIDMVPFAGPEVARRGLNVFAGGVELLDEASRLTERFVPRLAKALRPLSLQGPANLAISGSIIANRVGSTEKIDRQALHHSLDDSRDNHVTSVIKEAQMTLNMDDIFKPRRFLEGMPPSVALTSDLDALVGQQASLDVVADLQARYGSEKVMQIIYRASDHGLVFDPDSVESIAQLVWVMQHDAEAFVTPLAMSGAAAYRYETMG